MVSENGNVDPAAERRPKAGKTVAAKKDAEAKKAGEQSANRKIPGNLPYITAAGTLKRVLDRTIEASRPDKFNADFLENVLKMSGGSARATIPILKRMEFLTTDSVPTERYGKFRTDSGRSEAALHALKSAFPEIFKRSEYAYSIEDAKLKDIVMQITGLKAGEPVTMAIVATFKAIRGYIKEDFEPGKSTEDSTLEDLNHTSSNTNSEGTTKSRLGLQYNINIVIPETSDLKVLNAIFRSIKENLMR